MSGRRPSWRDQVLKAFTPQVSRLTLAADPDGLLLEEGVLTGVRERGFDLIPFDDHIAFRYAYESKYRARWDRGESTDLVVVLRAPSADLATLPYDLLRAGRRLSFSLADLFPSLSYPVIDCLDRGDLDALWRAQADDPPGQLGDTATKSYVLRHVFEILPEQIRRPADLLRVLLRRHFRNRVVPGILDEHIIRILRSDGRFTDWPLEQIVPDRVAFFAFLQERWPVFLASQAPGEAGRTAEPVSSYGLRFPGPANLPFDHEDVRVYIDSLFLEGHLRPVEHPRAPAWAKTWAAVGLRIDPIADRARKAGHLLTSATDSVPGPEARHTDWLSFALRWGELLALHHADGTALEPNLLGRFARTRSSIDEAFTAWVGSRYGSLHNQPAVPPVMVHHLPRHLAHLMTARDARKVALVVMDGLSLDQWVTIRESALAGQPELLCRERALFAWVPTLTAVSRQALFAGKVPLFFAASLCTTDKEPKLWSQFWADQGLASTAVSYARGLGDGPLADVEELTANPANRVLGLVVDKVDRIMHGVELGTAGMHAQVRLWARSGYLASLLALLVERGYEVHLTSDHGNIEATGMGRPAEGALAEERGARARVYANSLLRRAVKQQFSRSIEWPSLGLPDDYCPLLAEGREAFVPVGESVVSHGSIALEELIVPWVQIGPQRA
ncbi:MAG: alkaline phosphatase [Candidatus Rokubacteria bacterium GWA2_70_23]|nr:MAG: alkaline phosphatase [Candidatus Rokubacteria bacterium GWA2_70_23]